MMIRKFRNLLLLLLIYVILLLAGIFAISLIEPSFTVRTYATLLTLMTMITLGAYLLVLIGKSRPADEQGIYMTAAIGVKFIAYLIIILIYWNAGKNLSKDFIIAFFVLYLVLVIFLFGIMYKALKSK